MWSPNSFSACEAKAPKARRTIARIHGLGKIWQGVLNLPPSYTIEVISEIYDRMSPEDNERTLIHELLHIPGGFSGGFRPHKGYVGAKNRGMSFTGNCRATRALTAKTLLSLMNCQLFWLPDF